MKYLFKDVAAYYVLWDYYDSQNLKNNLTKSGTKHI